MAKYSTNPIASLDVDWSLDPYTGKKFSGGSVQAFIKQNLGAIARAAHFDAQNNTMHWFASEEDKAAYIADTSKTTLILYSTQLSFSSELYRIDLVNNNGSQNLNVATNEDNVNLSISYDVQIRRMEEGVWRSTGKGVYVSAYIDVGATGNYEPISEMKFMPAEQTYQIDVKGALALGVNRVRINFSAEGDSSLTTSITYTINLTEMFIESLNNEWYKPIVEGGDSANYKLGGFRIVGAVNKTLNIDIYSGSSKILHFEKLIGTIVYDRVPYYFITTDGLDLSSLPTGVYVVSAYLTSGALTSKAITYNIMYVRSEDRNTARLLCINNVETLAYNYTTAKLFDYCIYNQNSAYGSLSASVKLLNGTATASTTIVPLEDVTTSELHSFDFPLEWITEETLELRVQVTMEYGNEQIATVRIDNSATFPPTYGYDFYLNAASRKNTDTNYLKIVNHVTGIEYSPIWEKMTWGNNVDGWTHDETDRQCLLIPAGSKVTLPYTDYRILDGENISIELCYRVSNVSDYNENVITIFDDSDYPRFRGIRIRPTNILVHSSEDTSDINDLIRGANLMDEQVVHFVLTIYKDFTGHSNKNLVTGYINGCKNFQFEYNTGAVWFTNGSLVVGSEKSDVALYFVRVYRSVLSDYAVQANYINSMPTIGQREDLQAILKSIMDSNGSNIDYEAVKNHNKNFFVIEMANGAKVPSRKDGWGSKQTGLSALEMHFGEHPDWDWRIEGAVTSGQGTTSMNYYLWNIRWKIDDKSIGKKVTVKYLASRRTVGNSYVYDWGTGNLAGSVNFDGAGNHPSVKRITAKINFASSMHSHKMGATKAYSELHDSIELENEAQHYADVNDLPAPLVSIYQYPVYGFTKRGNTYEFIGLFTIGPDKNDKPTFGLDINNDIKSELIKMEGTDHSRKMVMFNYPWNSNVQYLASNECLNIVKGANDYDNGWEVSACHDYGTDEADDQESINTVLQAEFKPAYEVAYKNSTLIIGIPLGRYANTVEDTIEYINTHITTFQSELDSNNRMTYPNYQFWIEGDYVLYYYDIVTETYVPDIDLVEQNGSPVGSTVDEQNEWFKEQRRDRFRVEAQEYWNIPECIYHYVFIVLFGAMDNFGKNTYPYKMADFDFQMVNGALHNVGGKYAWMQDDLDSIFGIGNAGNDNMPYWMEFEDSANGSVYFGGSTSVFWNLIHECFMEDYLNAVTGAIRPGILSMGKQVLSAASSLAGGANMYEGIMLYIKQRFWDKAQNYFPQSAYNADAALKYEDAWLVKGQEVDPLSQSLGNHFSAEELWVTRRVIYMMSFFKAGPFGSFADASLGQISFRPQTLQSITVTPAIDLYPGFASGQGMVSTGRTRVGNSFTFVGPFGIDGQTAHYINASNYLTDLGDLKDLVLGAQYQNTLQIQGKKLVSLKIGDENPNSVHTNVPGLSFLDTKCLEVIDARNAQSISGSIDISGCIRLREAYFEGTSITQVKLTNGQRIEVLHLSDYITSISLKRLRLLDELVLPEDTSAFTLINIENCGIDGFDIVSAAFNSEGSSLRFIKLVFDSVAHLSMEDLYMLLSIAENKNKDGDDTQYGSVSDSGAPVITAGPYIEGTIETNFYAQDFERLNIVSEEDYETNLKKALSNIFDTNLYIIYNPSSVIIRFADEAVKNICVNRWDTDSDGELSVREASAVTSMSSVFNNDADIVTFDECIYFNRVTNWYQAFRGSSITRVKLPLGLRINSSTDSWAYTFYGCASLEELDLGDTVRLESGANIQTQWFTSCSALKKLYFKSIEQINAFAKASYTASDVPFNSNSGAHNVYVNGEELRDLVIPSTITAIRPAAFYRFNRLTSLVIPSGVTSIGAYAFYACNNIVGDIILPSTVTSVGEYAFNSCNKITNLVIYATSSVPTSAIRVCGNSTGTLRVNGNVGPSNDVNGETYRFINFIVNGSITNDGNRGLISSANGDVEVVRIKGSYDSGSNNYTGGNLVKGTGGKLKFLEILGTVTGGANLVSANTTFASGAILHLGYDVVTNNALPCTPAKAGANYARASKIYVGTGESPEGDEAILLKYLENSSWANYSSKLFTWWSYINDPDANPDYVQSPWD